MHLDIGTVVVIGAALIFYLRLIILQQQRIKRLAQAAPPGKGKRRTPTDRAAPDLSQRYGIISRQQSDWIVAGLGVAGVILGLLLRAAVLPVPTYQPYWWIPTAAGIIAFSWGFK